MSTGTLTSPLPAATAGAAHLLDLIGNTPLVELTRLDTGNSRLFVKLENQNPGGSIKDRPALSMITAFEKEGRLKPGGTLVEATAGNTGLGLALVAAIKGYRLILVIPDKMSREKVFHLKAMGADIVMTRSDVGKGHPDYYQDLAERIARQTPGAVFVNQFANPANPLAHETSTAPEIWRQMNHDIDAVVCGVGSSGTLTGINRFFRKVSPKTEIVLADPAGSVLLDVIEGRHPGEAGSWLVEGIGEDFVPPIADFAGVRKGYAISDRESFETARDLLRKEGILAGSSSGTLVAAALRYCREQSSPKRVVTLICDSGNKYLSKMFNDFWMTDQGFIERPRHGDLRDLVTRRHDEGAAITVGSEDTLNVAYARMKLYDVSQLPVLDDGKVVGILDESDVLLAVFNDHGHFSEPVKSAMTPRIETIDVRAPLTELIAVFDKGHVAIVLESGQFLGLITRIDLINHLRRKVD
ncbi:pyridoxal-phosphate dependent enzyme [Telmatospirillum siberiense]|uniref:Cysteine synthase B n=1 Tax=Telmatospirillum siberiense TaxID=382514 RepID=A0A2N3PYM1_9PROT|nr:cystathionine beta-synthase [Telmatospirillum siberiense]PKU25504.1 cystathionine beta-synthase [Telmatospirillum siberiense]